MCRNKDQSQEIKFQNPAVTLQPSDTHQRLEKNTIHGQTRKSDLVRLLKSLLFGEKCEHVCACLVCVCVLNGNN